MKNTDKTRIPKDLKDIDLTQIDRYIAVSVENMSEDMKNTVIDAGYDIIDEDEIYIWMPHIDKLNIPPECILWERDEIDEDMTDITMNRLLKPAEHYLVYASHCTWNGGDGYKFASSYSECIKRNYETTLIPLRISKGKKTLVCKESSHDVPLGGKTTIVALTDKEYDRLKNAAFTQVRGFIARTEPIAPIFSKNIPANR